MLCLNRLAELHCDYQDVSSRHVLIYMVTQRKRKKPTTNGKNPVSVGGVCSHLWEEQNDGTEPCDGPLHGWLKISSVHTSYASLPVVGGRAGKSTQEQMLHPCAFHSTCQLLLSALLWGKLHLRGRLCLVLNPCMMAANLGVELRISGSSKMMLFISI